MDSGQYVRHRGQRPDVGQAAAVDAHAVPDDPLPDQLLGQRAERGADLLLAPLELLGEPFLGDRLDPVGLGLAVVLAGDGQRLGQLVGDLARHRVVHVLGVVEEHRVLGVRRALGLGRLGGKPLLRLAQDLDERLGGFQALGYRVLGGGDGAAAGVG